MEMLQTINILPVMENSLNDLILEILFISDWSNKLKHTGDCCFIKT